MPWKVGFIVFLLLIHAAAADTLRSGGPEGTLSIAVEKARARETAFDGVDVRFSYGLSIGDYAAFSGRFVKDGRRFLIETVEKGENAATVFAQASDGFIERQFIEEAGNRTGEVYYPSPASYDRAVVWSPACMAGMTHTVYGKISDVLAGGSAGEPRAFKDGAIEGATNKVRTLDPATIDGHDCTAFEIERTTELSGKRTATRLYLAEDLGGACVRAEYENFNSDGERITRLWSFGDFREIRPGLHVAFESHCETRNDSRGTVSVIEARIDSFDFPSAFDPQLFTVDFPEDTEVVDRRPNDEKETVIDAVVPAAALEDVPNAPQGEAASPVAIDKPQTVPAPFEGPRKTPPPRGSNGALLAVLIAFFCIAAALIAKRKRRRS